MWPQPAAAEARPFGHRFLDPPTHRWYNQDIDWCICPSISLWFCYLFRGRYHIDYGAYLKVYCALQRGILEQIPQASYFPLSLIGKSLMWYSSIPLNSIQTWTKMKICFQDRFLLASAWSFDNGFNEFETTIKWIACSIYWKFRKATGKCSIQFLDIEYESMAINFMHSKLEEKLVQQTCHNLNELTSWGAHIEQKKKRRC